MDRHYFVYVMASISRVLYVGVTNDLVRRVWEHKEKPVSGFTEKYNVDRLVYYEVADAVLTAIAREKQIKGYRREKKLALIDAMNPEWKDLYLDLTGISSRQSTKQIEQTKVPDSPQLPTVISTRHKKRQCSF